MPKKLFSYQVKRLRVKLRNWYKSVDTKLAPSKIKITEFEEKAMKLWRITLRDKESKLSYNTIGIRQIERGRLFMIFKPIKKSDDGLEDFIMTIMDIGKDHKGVYEIHIPSNHASLSCDQFDSELEKRMRDAETAKRILIGDDLDRLLEEEKELKKIKE